MIDLVAENVMSLSEAAKSNALPRRRRGRRPNVSTLYRWARKGCNGVVLETIRVGGTLCTSLQAIQRFAVRLTVEDGSHDARVERLVSRRHEIEKAEGELRQAGFDQ